MTIWFLTLALVFLSQDAAPADVATLRYDWPAEGSVRVRDRILKKGRTAETTYLLSWAPAESGEGTVFEHTDFKFTALEGMDLDNPMVRAALRQTEALSAAIPRFRVDEKGVLQEFFGYERVVDVLLQTALKDLGEQQAAQIRQALTTPEMKAQIQGVTGETWSHWVPSWIGAEVTRGTEETWELDTKVTGGAFEELHFTFGERRRYRGLECVEISTLGEANEDLFLRKMLQMLGLIAGELDQELPDELPIARATRRDTTRGIYATAGLRPLEVWTDRVTRVWATKDGDPQEEVQKHHYRFEWEDLGPAKEEGG